MLTTDGPRALLISEEVAKCAFVNLKCGGHLAIDDSMGEPNSHGLKGFERLGAATRCERTTDQWSHHSPGFSPLTCVP